MPEVLRELLQKWLSLNKKNTGKKDTVRTGNTAHITNPVQPPVWDKEGMLIRLMDDDTLARKVISIFLSETPSQIQKIKTMSKTGNLAGIMVQAHTMKGACSNIGAERLLNIVRALETHARHGDADAVASHIGDLDKEFELLQDSVNNS